MTTKPQGPVHGLRRDLLGEGEKALASWAFHHHWVVLTNLRVLKLTGVDLLPHQREIDTALPLESIRNIEVVPFGGKAGPEGSIPIQGNAVARGFGSRMGSFSTSTPGYGRPLRDDPSTVVVALDGVSIFLGYPKDAEKVQDQLDRAWVARMQQLGRLK